MVPLIIFGAIMAAPVFLALLFRVNAVFVFLSICVGYFLQLSLSDSVDLVIATLVHGSNSIIAARFILLGLPVVLTLFFLRKTQGKSLIFQLVPLLFSGMLLGALALPLLPPAFAQNIYDSEFGESIRQSGDLVTALAAALNLVLAFLLFKGKHDRKKHH